MTTQRQAPSQPPQDQSTPPTDNAANQRVFIAMALTMSWRLALVVVVPAVGGNALDKHYHLFPWLTLAGLAVAAVGVFGVLHKTIMDANTLNEVTKPKQESK